MTRTLVFSLMLIAAQGFSPALLAQDTPADATAIAQQPSRAPLLKPGDHNCLRSTGSLIPPPKGGCLPVTGRSYSHEDIRRTGATTTGDALRLLDPSVQVRGH